MSISVYSDGAGELKRVLNESGWIDGEVVAAGQLRQGKAPSMLSLVVGWGVWEVIRPRRSKRLPRHFVLAATRDRVVAFKAFGGSGEDSSSAYKVTIRPGEQASYPLASVVLTGLEKGAASKGATMTIDGESFPVCRPNLSGDPNTDELIALLARLEREEPTPIAA